jgi:hypothetical protein
VAAGSTVAEAGVAEALGIMGVAAVVVDGLTAGAMAAEAHG